MADCLSEDEVLCFVEGRLAAARVPALEAHARVCSTCEQLLAAAMAAVSASSPRSSDGDRSLMDLSTGLARGALVGRYTVLSMVGRGGMGEVYAAYDPQLDRRVALKLLRPRYALGNERAEGRLLREARAIARLSHPNVIAVYDAGRVGDRIFVAMEYVDGQTLAAWLAAKPRTRREILEVFLGAAHGLAAAHASGLVHRDFKPHNVMVARDGTARVTDFGLVQRLGADNDNDRGPDVETDAETDAGAHDLALTRPGELVGTPLYMSPEQFKLEPTDARTDQFSFSVALYQALYGEHPFLADARAGVARLKQDVVAGRIRPVPARDVVPSWIRRVLLRGLATNPEARWPSMKDLAAAVEGPLRPERERDPAVGSHERMFVFGGMSVLGVVALVVLDLLRRSTHTAETTRLLVTPAIALTIHAVVAWVWRRRLLGNRFARNVAAMAWLGGITVVMHRLMAFRFGEPVPYVLAVDLLVLGLQQILAAMVLKPWFVLGALVFFGGAGVAMLAPAQALHAMLGSVIAAYAAVAVLAATERLSAGGAR
jgi:serine/threonine protein kinase